MAYTTVPAITGAVLLAVGLVLPWFQRRPSAKVWARDPVGACDRCAAGQRWPRRGALFAFTGALLIMASLQGVWASWFYLPALILQVIGYRLTFSREYSWWFAHDEWIEREHEMALLLNRLTDPALHANLQVALQRVIALMN